MQTNSSPVHRAGESAYLDSARSGLVPCKVTQVQKSAETGSLVVTARITAARGPYKRGETITFYASMIIPRTAVHYRGGIPRIRSYVWVP